MTDRFPSDNFTKNICIKDDHHLTEEQKIKKWRLELQSQASSSKSCSVSGTFCIKNNSCPDFYGNAPRAKPVPTLHPATTSSRTKRIGEASKGKLTSENNWILSILKRRKPSFSPIFSDVGPNWPVQNMKKANKYIFELFKSNFKVDDSEGVDVGRIICVHCDIDDCLKNYKGVNVRTKHQIRLDSKHGFNISSAIAHLLQFHPNKITDRHLLNFCPIDSTCAENFNGDLRSHMGKHHQIFQRKNLSPFLICGCGYQSNCRHDYNGHAIGCSINKSYLKFILTTTETISEVIYYYDCDFEVFKIPTCKTEPKDDANTSNG